MSTSIGDLLNAAVGDLCARGRTVRDAEAAIAVIGHAGRALERLAKADQSGNRGALKEHGRHAAELARLCAQAAAAWLPTTSRAADLVGGAADLASRTADELEPAQRWALMVEFAGTARIAVTAARRFVPYRDIPELAAAHRATAAVEQAATADPPTSLGRNALDVLVPAPPASGVTGLPAAAEAAVALATASHAAASRGTITLYDLLVTASAAEVASNYAAALVRAMHPEGEAREPWRAAPAAWRAVMIACAPFDDGTKNRPPASRIRSFARSIDVILRSALGPIDATLPDRIRARPDLPDVATHLRTLANQLPDLATHLRRGAYRWSEQHRLVAPERMLSSFEERNYSASDVGNRIVFAAPSDFEPLLSALGDARRLSNDLSVESHIAGAAGRQAQPNVVAARGLEVTDPAERRHLPRSAIRAERRAHATTRRCWSVIPVSDHGPPTR